MMPRMDVKMHLCHAANAKDSNIRQAIIDRYGPSGTVKLPNLIHGEVYGDKNTKMKKDLWAAWALSITWADKNMGEGDTLPSP